MTELNLLAVQNAAVLQALASPEHDLTIKGLAARLGRDDSNLGKTLTKLKGEGLLLDPPLSGLTDAGREQLAAIARAEHGGERRKARGRWPVDKIRPNPSNRPIDLDAVENLADAILGVGDVLQPLVLTPPDANGVRMILAGERRWRAVRLLMDRDAETQNEEVLSGGLVIAAPSLPEPLEAGVPFIERAATDAEATLITIVENTSREGLNPLDDAEQLYRYHQLTGLSARQIAKLTGRSPADSNRGERDVQIKIKIAREASDDAKAEYRRTGSWDALRDSVTKPKITGPANPRMALLVAEAAQVSEHLHGVWDGVLPLPPGLAWIAEANEWWTYAANGDFELSWDAVKWLAAQDFEEKRDLVMNRLRSDAGVPAILPGLRIDADAVTPPPAGALASGHAPLAEGDQSDATAATDAPTGYLARLGFKPGKPYEDKYDRHNPDHCVSDYAPDLPDWTRDAVLNDYLDGPVETFMLPWLQPQKCVAGYPQALIQVAPLKGGRGWVYGAGYSLNDIGHHERLSAVYPKKEAFPDRETAIAAGVDLILDSIGRNKNWKYPAQLLKWLDAPTPVGPHVVEGVDYLNAARAQEARFALGLDKRKANHSSPAGGGEPRSGGGGDAEAAKAHAATLVAEQTDPEQDAEDRAAAQLLADARRVLHDGRDWGLIAFALESEPILKAAGAWGPFRANPDNPGQIATSGDLPIQFDPWGDTADDKATAAAELLAALLNRALGLADPIPSPAEAEGAATASTTEEAA